MASNLISKLMFPGAYLAPYDFSKLYPEGEVLGSQGNTTIRVRFVHLPYQGSKDVLFYVPENSATLKTLKDFLPKLRDSMKMNVAAFEYPSDPEEKNVNTAMSIIYAKLNKMGYQPGNVVMWARGIGTGPACWLGSKFKAKGVVLINAYLSVQEAAKSAMPSATGVPNLWDNKEQVKKIKSPIWFFHAEKNDKLPFEHSKGLNDLCTSDKKSIRLVLGKDQASLDELTDVVPYVQF
jgi:hypothetical protein